MLRRSTLAEGENSPNERGDSRGQEMVHKLNWASHKQKGFYSSPTIWQMKVCFETAPAAMNFSNYRD